MRDKYARNPGADILDAIEHWLSTYIKFAQDNDLYILTLWAAHTHLVSETYTTPRLLLDSPAPGAGKTTTLDHLQRLCSHPVQAASLSSPAMLARLLERGPRTILVDEADRTLSPKMEGVGELLAVLNSGYRFGASRPVLVPDKESGGWQPREMSTFGPVAMAGNSPDLPDDTRSRCIRVLLLPDYDGDAEDSDWQFIEMHADLLREQIASWADDVRETVKDMRPEYPAGLRGRNRERWAPLLKVALAAGGPWPNRCMDLIASDLEDQESDREAGIDRLPRHVQLLRDIAEVWPDGEDFYSTSNMLFRLRSHRTDYWGEQNQYGALTPQGMGRMLSKHFNIKSARQPGNRSDGGRGYYQRFFLKSWQSFGIDVPTQEGVSQKPVKAVGTGRTGHQLTDVTGSDHSDRFPGEVGEPAENVAGLAKKDGLVGYPDTPSEPDQKPSEDDLEDTRVTIIHDAATRAADDGISGGKLMREVKDQTGDGSGAIATADEMVAAGILRSDNGRYYLNGAAA